MKNLKLFLSCLIIGLSVSLFGQSYQAGKLYIRIITTSAIPVVGTHNSFQFQNSFLNNLWQPYNIIEFIRAFPGVEHVNHPNAETLSRVYEVTCNCDETTLMNDLQQNANSYYDLIEKLPILIPTYTPDDYGYGDGTGGWNNVQIELDQLNAKQAWDITKGNPDIKIALVECCNGFDVNHEDFVNADGTNQIVLIDNSVDQNPPASHGTAVAGMAAGATDNSKGWSSIGFNCKLMLYEGGYDKIKQAALDGAKVISNSWIHCGSVGTSNQMILDLVHDMGVVVLAGAGNGNQGSSCNGGPSIGGSVGGIYKNGYGFPASADHVISVSSVDLFDTYAGPGGNLFHTFNDKVDITAPGFNTQILGNNNTYNSHGGWGTSFATPMVAGVCGLILSVNPCLSPDDVEEILKATADDISAIGNNIDFAGYDGAGRVNAYKAVKLASDMYNAGLDLFSKDGQTGDDFGIEPYTGTGLIYLTNDIWVRNQADGIANQISENPEHSSTGAADQLNYVYVRVRNKGCVASTGTETLDLRWAKASTSLSWPTNWNGTLDLDPPNNAIAGDSISTQTIPVIPAGGETILEFTWNPPSPADYSFNTEPWHFCLLSRILATNDPMTETSDLAANVRNNNNIVWKNLAVVDNIADKIGGVCPAELINGIGVAVAVRNPDDKSSTFDIEFSVPQEELANPITQEGKVMLALDAQLYEKWVQGGKQGTGFNEILSPPMSANGANNNQINSHSPIVISNRKMFEATGTTTQFNNITLQSGESRTTAMMVTYPTDPVSTKQNFKYDIIQKRNDNGEFIGGVRYDIRKPVNDDPPTDAGNNVTIKRGCNTTLTASPQNDCYVYFWLNQQGNIISRQPSITVSPNNTTTYTVKIVSSKGFVSKDDVTVTVLNQQCVKEREIIRITPNPAKERITVKYRAENTNVAHLRLVKMDNSIDKTYQLNLQMTEITLNISDCTYGFYVIALVCDGVNADSKTLIKH